MTEEQFITSSLSKKDANIDETLRPQYFNEFPSQVKIKNRVELFIQAASKSR